MKKIKYISVKDRAIPINWNLSVTEDIDWHNAVIMSTVMSRGTDTSKLWNGTILFVEYVSQFTLELPHKLTFGGVKAEISANTQVPKSASFGTTVEGFTLAPSHPLEFSGDVEEHINPAILTHYNESFTELPTAFTLSPLPLEFSRVHESISTENIQQEE